MMLLFLLVCPLGMGLLALIAGKWARFVALVSVFANALGVLIAWRTDSLIFLASWLPEWGANFHFELDGLSFSLVAVAHIMALLAIFGSWEKITEKTGFFYGNILWLLAGVVGVLISFDLLLFFIFWELMIIPIYIACALWGGPKRQFASIQFLIFTQASGLILLVAILGLYFVHYNQNGFYTFDFSMLLHSKLSASTQLVLLSGFLIAFLVKLPALGFHVWLPLLFESSPIGLILVGIMVKTGAYGILRFALPLFPEGAALMAPYMMAWGGAGLIYGALLAFSQSDVRKILAYATISHMGVVLMALFSASTFAYQGVVILLITEALSTGGLLLVFSGLHNTSLERLGGLWSQAPKVGVVSLFFIMSSVGLPFLGNFVGEYMSMVGIFSANIIAAAAMALGLVLSAIYYLRLMQKIFFGPCPRYENTTELSVFQSVLFGSIISMLLFLGLYPSPFLSIITQTTLLLE